MATKLGSSGKSAEDEANAAAVPTLAALRKRVTGNQRQILNVIWGYYLNHSEWMPTRILHHQLGKELTQTNITQLGGSIVWKMWELPSAKGAYTKDTYWLTLLGIILSDRGVEGEALLLNYFEYLRSEFLKNPEMEKVTSAEIGKALQLNNEQLRYLRELIRIGEFWDIEASFRGEWECGVPREIDDLPSVADLHDYLQEKIMYGYDPNLPINPNDHSDYLLSKEVKAEGKEFGFIQDTLLRDQLGSDWEEVKRNREAKAWKSCVILCGGILEGVLLDVLQRDEPKAKVAYHKLKIKNPPDLSSWNLVDLVEVAKDIGLLNKSVGHLGHGLREFRNLVHPGKQVREKVSLTEEEAEISYRVVQVYLREFSSRFLKT